MSEFTRRQIALHNCFSGHIRRAELAMMSILNSSTVSKQSKVQAALALSHIIELKKSIKKRIDQ